MNAAPLKLALDDVQRMMRSDDGGKWPREDEITAALRADHSMNGGRYPTTDEVLSIVTKDPNYATARAFTVLNTLLGREVGASFVEPNREFLGRSWANIKCYVRPRYSAGSGAMVPDHVALQVAIDELRDYGHAIEGSYGPEQKRRAEVLGLRGVAYAMAESGAGRKFRWLVQDLVTGECFRRMHDHEVVRQGFTPFRELSLDAQAMVRDHACRDDDYERTYWKYEARKWVKYEPELARVEP